MEKNIHTGRRAFILGNGPSLEISDLHRLRHEITFASNKIYLAYNQTDWRPTYYTVCDYLVAANNVEMINAQPSFALFPEALKKYGCHFDRGCWYRELFDNAFGDAFCEERDTPFLFSRDVTKGVQGGYTVIYHQLQWAYYMGIREVYLIGVDFFFRLPKTTTIDERFKSSDYRNALVSDGEINHFHPDYRQPGEKWSMPKLDLQRAGFSTARDVFQAAGGRLINASRQTSLDVLSRMNFDDVIDS